MASMTNGDARPHAATYPNLGGSVSMNAEPPLITVNQINITGKQLWAVITAVVTLLGSGALGGILFWPAKATDVEIIGKQTTELAAVTKQVTDSVEAAKQDQHEIRQLVVGLSISLDRVTEAVSELQGVLQSASETRTAPEARPAPKTRAKPKTRAAPPPRPASAPPPAGT